MPALPIPDSLAAIGQTAAAAAAALTNTPEPLQVICSFPVSGQYGPGSRILYYVLVAACVLARKTEWLRNACLAAALIFPATAAIHAIVLAALHNDDAVDLDIYGALQLCTIGVLTAPSTVRLSETYFNQPGRNVLFVWTALVLAGLLALAVEFFRIESRPCSDDGSGQPLYKGSQFPYGRTSCGLVCSTQEGPHSPLRENSANDIYVVPTPHMLTFGAATLIAAACCIPGILSMISIWDKILRTNWAKRFGDSDESDDVIEGTNGATVRGMKGVNSVIRRLLGVVEVPVFAGAVLALIVIGERNFWSGPLIYQTETIGNVSQWSNIVASILAACGSLYMLLAKYLESAENGPWTTHQSANCPCQCHGHGSSSRVSSLSDHPETAEMPRPLQPARTSDTNPHVLPEDTSPSHVLTPIRTDTYPDVEAQYLGLGIHPVDTGSSTIRENSGRVAERLAKIVTALGTASSDRFDDHNFRMGKATGFPEIPGEGQRNSNLSVIKQQWGEISPNDDDGQTLRGRRSRANSFHSVSRANSIGPRAHSPQPPTRSPTVPVPSFLGLPTRASPESALEPVFPARHSAELDKTKSQSTVVTLHQSPNSPAIVLSSEHEPGEPSTSAAAAAASQPPTAQEEELPPPQPEKNAQ